MNLQKLSESGNSTENQSNILEKIAAGDKFAVAECLDKYGKMVWSAARKFNNTREDAEDAVQEIFIDIWKYAGRFDADKSPEGAFVMLIAKRRLIDRLRKANTQPNQSLIEYALANRPGDDDKKLQMYVEMKYAVEALDKLGASEKQILKMAIYGGMSHSEIAKAFGMPLGTVKSQLRRGLQKIRHSIGLTGESLPTL